MRDNVLVVLTNQAKYPNRNRATGLWLGMVVRFAERLYASGYTLDYASCQGGYVPIDPESLAQAEEMDWQWYQDRKFMNRIGCTLKLEDVNPDNYKAIYFAGGHGCLWEYPDNETLQNISRTIYEHDGIVASVCHGVCGLWNIKLSDGTYLIAGREVTGFSREEEKLADLDQLLPFATEDELAKRGAIYRKADRPFTPFAAVSERVVTGQNAQSIRLVADKVLELLIESVKSQIEIQSSSAPT
ncbi:MAG: type 1 glutamine amidotransferase domain-containing protein [Sedimentisphaerales bacterium]|nr:type 1 glutamine amidotransferase domain-containing protein [Sedimentisphaerales bacterium]